MITVAGSPLIIGGMEKCQPATDKLAVVHACKHPCYMRASKGATRPLVIEQGHDLYLNMIDPSQPLFSPEPFVRFLAFARTHVGAGRTLVIHCNQGLSRAPSLALLLCCRWPGHEWDSFKSARYAWEHNYPRYQPGAGITQWLTEHWEELK